MRPVYLKWIDSCNLFGDRWARSEELDQHEEETYCETLGWLAKQNEHSFYVAGSLAPEEIGSVMQIPRGAVKELREVNWIGKTVVSAAEEASVVEFRRPESKLSRAGQVSCCEREGSCGAGCQGRTDVEGAGVEDRLESEPRPREGA